MEKGKELETESHTYVDDGDTDIDNDIRSDGDNKVDSLEVMSAYTEAADSSTTSGIIATVLGFSSFGKLEKVEIQRGTRVVHLFNEMRSKDSSAPRKR